MKLLLSLEAQYYKYEKYFQNGKHSEEQQPLDLIADHSLDCACASLGEGQVLASACASPGEGQVGARGPAFALSQIEAKSQREGLQEPSAAWLSILFPLTLAPTATLSEEGGPGTFA